MKFPFLLAGFIIFVVIFIALINQPATTKPVAPAPTPSSPAYTVDSLMSHVAPSSLVTEKDLPSPSSKYTSKIVSYTSENLKLFALLHIPTSPVPSSGWPLIILNHGYIAPSKYSTVDSYKNTAAYYASQGFIVLKPDYRGHDKSSGVADPVLNRLQYAVDVLNLIAALPSLPDTDPHRLYLYGHSMGGEVSLLVAENYPKLSAISLWAPAVAPFPQDITYFLRRHALTPTDVPLTQARLQALTSQYGTTPFSAFDNTQRVTAPVLIQQGTADESVPFAWGQSLHQKLIDTHQDVTFFSYALDNHDISNHWSTALSKDVEFFNSH